MVEEYSDQELDEILDKVHKWGVAFSNSKYYQQLTEEQQWESEGVIVFFAEFMYSYLELSPEEWDVVGLDECCLDILPRKVSAEESFFKAIAPVLSAFFTFLAERRLLRRAAALAKKVARIDKQIVRAASDPRRWGMAKSLVMAAMDAGVDVTDEEEMAAFTASLNLQRALGLPAQTNIEPVPKIGRNDPCPCGSGKKYKYCCGRRDR